MKCYFSCVASGYKAARLVVQGTMSRENTSNTNRFLLHFTIANARKFYSVTVHMTLIVNEIKGIEVGI